MQGRQIVAAVKQPTTADVSGGILHVLDALLSEVALSPDAISAVMIGTTHFTSP